MLGISDQEAEAEAESFREDFYQGEPRIRDSRYYNNNNNDND